MKKIKKEDKKFLVSLSKNHRLRLKLKDIYKAFGDFPYVWKSATFSDFKRYGFSEDDFEELSNLRNNIIPDEQMEILLKQNINTLSIGDDDYPKLLKEIADPPLILFVKGNLKTKNNTFAIVGARRPTQYGMGTTITISEKISQTGMVIVSGMAIGIDTLSHKGALNVGGRTIAVLGSGIDESSIYPSSNRDLSQKILENDGALVSEYPPGYQIYKTNFPERNRIISGLSKGVLIVEARIRSGALITANFALEQNREVFAIPGDINRKESEGPNNLIKQGAKPVTSYQDVLEEFGIESEKEQKIKADSEEEAKILEVLKDAPLYIDSIAKKSGLTISKTSSTLSLMEIKDKVSNLGAQNFSIKR